QQQRILSRKIPIGRRPRDQRPLRRGGHGRRTALAQERGGGLDDRPPGAPLLVGPRIGLTCYYHRTIIPISHCATTVSYQGGSHGRRRPTPRRCPCRPPAAAERRRRADHRPP